ARGNPVTEPAVLPGMGELVGNRAKLDDRLVVHAREAAGLLEEQEHEDVDRDQRHRDEREVVRRDVVLEREHGRRSPAGRGAYLSTPPGQPAAATGPLPGRTCGTCSSAW